MSKHKQYIPTEQYNKNSHALSLIDQPGVNLPSFEVSGSNQQKKLQTDGKLAPFAECHEPQCSYYTNKQKHALFQRPSKIYH